MNPDGTYQTEMYGNQTGTPNSFQHSRGIPGSRKILTILGGYHTTQGGKLAIMDVLHGAAERSGADSDSRQQAPRLRRHPR